MSKKRKTDWKQNLFTVLLGLSAVAFGFCFAFYIDEFFVDKATGADKAFMLLSLLIGMYVSIFVNTIIHEAGHLVFGLLTGYKFSSFRIHNLMWVMENDKIKFKRHSIAGTAGQCLMSPPDMVNGKFPVVLYNLGGCIFNFIVAVISFLSFFIFKNQTFFAVFILGFGVSALILAVSNGIPLKTATVNNDGYNTLDITRNSDAMNAFWLQLKIVEQTSKGVRLKDMPSEWFEFPTDDAMQNSMVATSGVFAANRLLDEQKFAEAAECISHLLEIESGIAGIHRNLIICDRIFIELIGENCREAVGRLLTKEQKKFMKQMRNFLTVLRTEYALALLYEEDIKKAEKIKAEFEKRCKTHPYKPDIESEKELINIADEKFKA
ncbi:MAG: hypothetical protein J6A78_01725 [Clostridia bacterium]|nr:hypothetical protein [Clostridia bacterium]